MLVQAGHGFADSLLTVPVIPCPGAIPGPVKVRTLPATGIKSCSAGRVPRKAEGEDTWPAKKMLAVPGTVSRTEPGKQPAIPKPESAARTVNFKLVMAVTAALVKTYGQN